MSGGVDSSVSALLLKQQGYQVTGLYMHNWEQREEQGQCTGETDFADASKVCEKIGIPLHRVSFVKEYWNNVFTELIEGLKVGITPNPDVLCNRHIKFQHLYNYATNNLKADCLATGHYAQIGYYDQLPDSTSHLPQPQPCLTKAVDSNKDQTYFLCQISGKVLDRVIFPVGHLTKPQVREIAETAGLATATKKDSVGICFIGKRTFEDFIGEYMESRAGDICLLGENAKAGATVVAQHRGLHGHTIGQRARLGGHSQPLFVCGKDIDSRTVFVCEGHSHPALYYDEITATDMIWINGAPPEKLLNGSSIVCEYRVRHRQPLGKCIISLSHSAALSPLSPLQPTIGTTTHKAPPPPPEPTTAKAKGMHSNKSNKQLPQNIFASFQTHVSKTANNKATTNGCKSQQRAPLSISTTSTSTTASSNVPLSPFNLNVRFLCPQRAPMPGQVICLYSGDVCLGGAVIHKLGPSYYTMGKTVPQVRYED